MNKSTTHYYYTCDVYDCRRVRSDDKDYINEFIECSNCFSIWHNCNRVCSIKLIAESGFNWLCPNCKILKKHERKELMKNG